MSKNKPMAVARRTQQERVEATREKLIAAARNEFVTNGFSATSTSKIVEAAGVTRGALYHHFSSKEDLFAGVIEAEAKEVAEAIERATAKTVDTHKNFVTGALAFLDAMDVPGRSGLLLVDAPAILGVEQLAEIDAGTGSATLVAALQQSGLTRRRRLDVEVLAAMLSSALDRAALSIELGADREKAKKAVVFLLECLLQGAPHE